MRKSSRMGILLLIIAILLQGCVNVAVSGAQAVYNRQSLKKTFMDQYITMQAHRLLKLDTDQFADCNIFISTFHNEVLLVGQVQTKALREAAEKIVKDIPEVEHVYNFLKIAEPVSSLTHMHDAWITSEIKTLLIASEDCDATQIKVVTEDGMVYLMGTVEPDAAFAAIDIARNVSGVNGVVKLFSYIHISKK